MLITLSRRTAICQSVAEVQLTGVAPLGAVSHRYTSYQADGFFFLYRPHIVARTLLKSLCDQQNAPNTTLDRTRPKDTETQKHPVSRPILVYRIISLHWRKILWQSKESNPRSVDGSVDNITTEPIARQRAHLFNCQLTFKI